MALELSNCAATAAPAPGPRDGNEVSGDARKILIIANPTAGGFRAAVLDRIAAALRGDGRAVELHLTSRAGEIGEICSNPNLAVDIVVVAGGDGSVNEALTGFEAIVAPPALAVVPFGTANVLACELSLPRRADAIARMILRRRTRPLHYGTANGRPFVLMASCGFDAEVVHAVPLKLKRRLGKAAYVLSAFKVVVGRPRRDIAVEIDGETLRCRLAVVANSSHYGGPFVLCPQAGATREGLHLIALMNDSFPALVRVGIALLRGRLSRARDVVMRPVTHAVLRADEPVAAQIDGDPFGTTPIEVAPAARALTIIVP
ncbi:YegS/Rv2252/BmrU family lipid kinase [Breoghania sp. L-A4]|uniref:diacylglycerol/lipid kinase family protein n=1 Tax=Breoghania sp. L-A4 TaxID=2304600 RepID=UPI000E358DA9|nr:YegS/Rv2252/BmrU family lipid kinase [Breoghania sp. L-A4]AXS39502.1 YegS/Rv2252/BmrU family lipid kinase [Breoghania sp. L-A4]